MAMAFQCSVCGASLLAHEDRIAAHVQCPECEAFLDVPDPTAARGHEALVAEERAVKFRHRAGRGEAEMDMTPMVDVVFLLLIFFMVTAAFSLQKSFEVPAPRDDRPTTAVRSLDDFSEEPDFVIVRIDQFNTYHVSAAEWSEEREAPSRQDLLIALSDARRGDGTGHPPTQLLVVANGEATHDRVVTAMDAGTHVGMVSIKLVTVEEDES
jgi:biopolymer transport protein ExbD